MTENKAKIFCNNVIWEAGPESGVSVHSWEGCERGREEQQHTESLGESVLEYGAHEGVQ